MREWGKQQKQKEQPHSFQSAIINWRHTSKPNFLHETGPLTYFVNERSWNNTAFILNPRSPFSLRPHFHSLRYRAESTTHYFRRVGKINRTSSGLWGPFISLFFSTYYATLELAWRGAWPSTMGQPADIHKLCSLHSLHRLSSSSLLIKQRDTSR